MGLRLQNGSTILVNMSLKNLSDAYELTIPGFGNARVDGFYVQKNSGQTMQKARSWKLCLLDDGPRNAGMFGSICFGAGRGGAGHLSSNVSTSSRILGPVECGHRAMGPGTARK